MENFRDFQAGPDPFGRTWQVQFKWQLNGISTRHSDSVDVKFRLQQDGETMEKVIALMHPDLLELSTKTGKPITDAWVSRLAALHLMHMIETGEDMEKDLVTVTPEQIEQYSAKL